MQMLVIIYNHLLDDQIKKVLADNKVKGYSEIPRVFGSGEVGAVEDSRHAPGYNSSIFTVMPEEQVQPLLASLAGLAEEHKKVSSRPYQLHVFSLPCEKIALGTLIAAGADSRGSLSVIIQVEPGIRVFLTGSSRNSSIPITRIRT